MTSQVQTTQATWTMSYEGPTFDDGAIGAPEFASVLISLQHLFARSSLLVSGPEIVPTLRVQPRPPGSLEFITELTVPALLVPLLPSARLTAPILRRLVVGDRGLLGILGFIAALKGRIPRDYRQSADTIVVENSDRRTTVPLQVFTAATDRDIRVTASGLFAPLHRDIGNHLTVKDGNQTIFSVNGSDVSSIEYGETMPESPLASRSSIRVLELVEVNVENRNANWKFREGNYTRAYSIRDEEFLERVFSRAERFGRGDVFVCEVVQWESIGRTGKPSPKLDIIRVLRHEQPSSQGSLFEDTQ